MNELETSATVAIEADRRCLAAITTPELIKRWFFGVDTQSDWERSSSGSIGTPSALAIAGGM